MEVEVKQVEGSTFVGKGDSNHWLTMDTEEKHDGSEAASQPMELLLVGLGGCTGMDVNTLLNKMQVDYDDLKLDISAEREEDHPKVFTKIELTYKIYGEDLPEDKVAKAVRLTQERYCPATHSLKNPAEVSYEYEIIEPE